MSASYPPDARGPRLVFGMVPQRDDEKTRVLLNDLCARLSSHVGIAVSPHRAPSPEALANALRMGRVHFAWTGALLLLVSDQMSDMVPILSSVREGAALYHSALFVGADSPIREIEAARGKRVAWVSATSASGYVVPRLSLAKRGIDVGAFFGEETFLGSHTGTARAVFQGQADLGATYVVFQDGDSHKPIVKAGFLMADAGRKVHILDVSGPVPGDLIVAAPAVPLEARRAISSALQRVADDRGSGEIMRDLIGADAFSPFSPVVLRELRALVRAARASGALPELRK